MARSVQPQKLKWRKDRDILTRLDLRVLSTLTTNHAKCSCYNTQIRTDLDLIGPVTRHTHPISKPSDHKVRHDLPMAAQKPLRYFIEQYFWRHESGLSVIFRIIHLVTNAYKHRKITNPRKVIAKPPALWMDTLVHNPHASTDECLWRETSQTTRFD